MNKSEKASVQTGLRVPAAQYEKIDSYAKAMGLSFNKTALMLIGIGITCLDRGLAEYPRE